MRKKTGTHLRLVDGSMSAERGDAMPKRARNRIFGFAAYVLSAMAFVDPTLAAECEDTAEALRVAAQEANLSAAELAQVEASVNRALSSRADGDELGCLSRLAEVRDLLKRG